MQFTDAVTVAGTRRRDDGYLLADARIARTGVQEYLGDEVGKPDMAIVRVYRPGSEVFADATMSSAAHRPVTNDHPAELVTSDNWKEHAVGQTGDEISGEGIFLRVPLMVKDGGAIKDIEAGKRELSAGYTCDLDFTAGKTPSGEAYDAIQKNIRINHVAIVARGRAGSEVRIGDAAHWGASPVNDTIPEKDPPMTLKTVTVDGIPIEVTDQGATVIATLQQRLIDASKAKETLAAEHATALADPRCRDGQEGCRDRHPQGQGHRRRRARRSGPRPRRSHRQGQGHRSRTSRPTARPMPRSARLSSRRQARRCTVKDKPAAYIDARFDILAEDAKPEDPVRGVIDRGLISTDERATIDKAQGGYVNHLTNAWKGETKGAA
jgi:hypothetical protein